MNNYFTRLRVANMDSLGLRFKLALESGKITYMVTVNGPELLKKHTFPEKIMNGNGHTDENGYVLRSDFPTVKQAMNPPRGKPILAYWQIFDKTLPSRMEYVSALGMNIDKGQRIWDAHVETYLLSTAGDDWNQAFIKPYTTQGVSRLNTGGPVEPIVQRITRYTERGLTAGEKAMASKVFTGALRMNLDTVRMTNKPLPYQNLSNIPGTQVAMTPLGIIHWPIQYYRDDYSNLPSTDNDREYVRHTFIHELAHVWQNRRDDGNLGVAVSALIEQANPVRLCGGSAYRYNILEKTILGNDKLFSQYGTEQQAEIIADYYFAKFEGKLPSGQNRDNGVFVFEYEKKLKNPTEGYDGVD